MNLAETHDLLRLAAAYDNRRIDDTTVVAWQELLAGLDFDDARAALLDHFAGSEAYLMPVHIVTGARTIAHRRNQANRPAIEPSPPGIPLDLRSANGELEQLRAILPAARAGILRRREWYEHEERAKQRHLTAIPNEEAS